MINATGTRASLEITRQARLASAIAETQISVSTGKRIQKPSDDPVASARVGRISRAQADETSWRSNLDLGIALSAQADSVFRTLNDRLARVQELAVAGASGALPPDGRNTIAAEMRSIAGEIDALSLTTTQLGEPLFSPGLPREMRFGVEARFAAVPSRTAAFEIGGASISSRLTQMAQALESGDTARIGAVPGMADGLVRAASDTAAGQGITASRLERMREANLSRGIDLAAERSTLEDTDLSSAIATLNAQTLTLEAAQAAFARINRRTLLDILS